MYVYLLGAGASCKALPLVKDFSAKLGVAAQNLINEKKFIVEKLQAISNNNSLIYYIDPFIESLQSLANESKYHASIDTLARRYYLTNEFEKLLDLKSALSGFLIYEQLTNPVDIRYDSLIASITDRNDKGLALEDRVKIITWNYDAQIEMAFYPYNKNMSTGLEKRLQIYPIESSKLEKIDANKFCVIRLNGQAGLYGPNDEKTSKLKSIYSMPRENASVEAITVYAQLKYHIAQDNHPKWHFTWEENASTESIRSAAFQAASTAERLIVIGYSFPFFNRNVDKQLFASMKNLKEIYIQTHDSKECSNIHGRIKRFLPGFQGKIEHIVDPDQFYIPHDL